jgi:two-component system, OmpR family, alkaline phosphatase synthesis response regulator PhoP
MSLQVLIVEDEPGLILTLSDLMKADGYFVETASDGTSGLAAASSRRFDLIVLDVMLPGLSGLEVCRNLRQRGCDTPLIMLTARTQIRDRVAGLKLGADDYLAKPFDPAELLARAEALLRRTGKKQRAPISHFTFGTIKADFENGRICKDSAPITLSAKELLLLRYLVDRRGTVVARNELLQAVWQYQSEISTRTVDVHVSWLRQKLEENPQSPKYIQTVRGTGYIFKN